MDRLLANEFERRALELAWWSCRAGTTGVGALLVDEDGTILAEGNNAIYAPAQAGPLFGSRVAHAEMNVFAQIPGGVHHRHATLYTSLEPCAMCSGAIINHRIKDVRILASDPLMHDLDAIGDRNEWVRNRWRPRTFSDDPTAQRIAALFAGYHYFSKFDETHPYVGAVITTKPDIANWMTGIVRSGTIAELMASDANFDQALAALI